MCGILRWVMKAWHYVCLYFQIQICVISDLFAWSSNIKPWRPNHKMFFSKLKISLSLFNYFHCLSSTKPLPLTHCVCLLLSLWMLLYLWGYACSAALSEGTLSFPSSQNTGSSLVFFLPWFLYPSPLCSARTCSFQVTFPVFPLKVMLSEALLCLFPKLWVTPFISYWNYLLPQLFFPVLPM